MSGKLTFTIIKPDAVEKGYTGQIIDQIIKAGFKVRAMRMVHMFPKEARGFYAVHKERPFFNDLVAFMSSAPCIPMALEREAGDAVTAFRELIGKTNPADAAEGTIRKQFAESIERNAIHGSDSDDNAHEEINYFFSGAELFED